MPTENIINLYAEIITKLALDGLDKTLYDIF